MAAVETSGSTSATPSPRSGHTAPNRWAELKPCWRTPRGRTPFWYQTWVTPPFWPTRASSMNQSSTRSTLGCRAAASRITPGRVFEALLRLRVRLGMDRPRLLPGEVEALEQLEHPALAVAHPKAALDQGAQVAGAPGHAAVTLKVRAPEDQCLKGRLLAVVQGAGSAGPGPVAQALHALRVVAVDPVAECLPGHAGKARGFLPGQAVERVGERQQAGTDAAVALAAREAAQLDRVMVGADRQGCGHGGISKTIPPKRLSRPIDPSPIRPAGIILALRSGDGRGQPRKVGERAQPPRLVEERVPGGAGRVHHGLVAAGEDAVAEPAVAEIL